MGRLATNLRSAHDLFISRPALKLSEGRRKALLGTWRAWSRWLKGRGLHQRAGFPPQLSWVFFFQGKEAAGPTAAQSVFSAFRWMRQNLRGAMCRLGLAGLRARARSASPSVLRGQAVKKQLGVCLSLWPGQSRMVLKQLSRSENQSKLI